MNRLCQLVVEENSSRYFLIVAIPSVVEMFVNMEVASVVTIFAFVGSLGNLSSKLRRSVLFFRKENR